MKIITLSIITILNVLCMILYSEERFYAGKGIELKNSGETVVRHICIRFNNGIAQITISREGDKGKIQNSGIVTEFSEDENSIKIMNLEFKKVKGEGNDVRLRCNTGKKTIYTLHPVTMDKPPQKDIAPNFNSLKDNINENNDF